MSQAFQQYFPNISYSISLLQESPNNKKNIQNDCLTYLWYTISSRTIRSNNESKLKNTNYLTLSHKTIPPEEKNNIGRVDVIHLKY